VSTPMKVRLAASDRSGGLGVQLSRDMVELPPAGRGASKVPVKVIPWKRSRGSGAAALTFNVSATPIDPPGDTISIDGRYVALPALPRWVYFLLLALLFLILLFTPLYTQAFYVAGWEKNRTWQEVNAAGTPTSRTQSGKHKFPSDVS